MSAYIYQRIWIYKLWQWHMGKRSIDTAVLIQAMCNKSYPVINHWGITAFDKENMYSQYGLLKYKLQSRHSLKHTTAWSGSVWNVILKTFFHIAFTPKCQKIIKRTAKYFHSVAEMNVLSELMNTVYESQWKETGTIIVYLVLSARSYKHSHSDAIQIYVEMSRIVRVKISMHVCKLYFCKYTYQSDHG